MERDDDKYEGEDDGYEEEVNGEEYNEETKEKGKKLDICVSLLLLLLQLNFFPPVRLKIHPFLIYHFPLINVNTQ